MPTPRELLGDEVTAKLQEQGLSPGQIRAMAKSAWELQKEEQASTNEQRMSDASKIDNDAIRFGAGIAKGALEGTRGTLKLVEDAANFLDPHRKSAMNGKYSEPVEKMGTWIHRLDEYQKNYKSTIGDSWDMASFGGEAVGGFVDPINLIPIGAASWVKRSIGFAVTGAMSGGVAAYGGDRNVGAGALTGAVAAPIIGNALHYGARGLAHLWTKAKERQIKQAQTTEDFNNISSNELFDIPLMKKEDGTIDLTAPIKEQQTELTSFADTILKNETDEVKSQAIQDVLEGKKTSVIDEERFNDLSEFNQILKTIEGVDAHEPTLKLVDEELSRMNEQIVSSTEHSAVRYNDITKNTIKWSKENPSMLPSQLKTLINATHKPSPEEILISNFVNDGVPVENRVAGWNVFYMLEKEIANPTRTPEEFMQGLQKAGYTEEVASIFAEAYAKKDSTMAKNFMTEKISTKGSEYVSKSAETFNTSKRNGNGGLSNGKAELSGEAKSNGDASQGRGSDELNNQQRQDASFDNGERALLDDGQNSSSPGEGSGLPKSDETMGGQQTAGGDGDGIPRPGSDPVVQPKDGDGTGAKLEELKSVLSSFPEAQVLKDGNIALSNFSESEKAILKKHGLVETSKAEDGSTFESVNPNVLWELRKEYQAKNPYVSKVTIEEKIEGAKKRRMTYLSKQRDLEELGDLADADELAAVKSKVDEMDVKIAELEKEKFAAKKQGTNGAAEDLAKKIEQKFPDATIKQSGNAIVIESGRKKLPEDDGGVGAYVTEVMFKTKKDGRSMRGQLVELPFGLKGVAVVDKGGKSGTIYEHGTASQLSTWGDNTSRQKMDEALLDASSKIEKVGKERLMSKYEEFRVEGKVINDEIITTKNKSKNSETNDVPKEKSNTTGQGDAKKGAEDASVGGAMDGQSGEMASSPKEVTTENVDLNSKEAIALSKGERKRINQDVDAILAKKSEEITEADKEVLRQYTGNGGIESGTYGSLSEHYTPYETVRGIYDALDRAGVPIKKALEPAVGSGNFVGHRPGIDWTTIDVDTKAHAINKILYPEAKHYNTSFENFKGDGFDAIISNVPFIETRGVGALKNRPDVKALHDYYFVSAVDKVKDDGVVAFVTSRGTMDKADFKVRQELMDKADIIGAYRLPEGTFSKNAHTDVGADVIFLQKRAQGVKAEGKQLANNEAFIKSSKSDDGIYLNDYFQKNPEKILGEMEAGVNKQFGTKAYTVKGKADYSKMSLDYHKGDTGSEPLGIKETDIPTESHEFWDFADEHGLEVHGFDESGIVMRDGSIKVAQTRVEFSDIDGGARLYKDITGTPEGNKIALLEKINQAGEAHSLKEGQVLIKQYQKEFKTHPYKDKALVRLFDAIGEKDKFYELGSYFDDTFKPAQIFEKTTKFEGSGKMDVSADAPIQSRLIFHENNKGVVDIAKGGEYIKEGDLYNALENGYSLSGKGQVQNDILYHSGNLYEKINQVQALMEHYKDDGILLSKLEKQISSLEEALPTRKTVEEINVRGDEPWLLQNGLEIYPLRKVERTINKGEQKIIEYETGLGKVFDNYINSKALISLQKDESLTSYRRRLRDANEEVQNVLSRIKEKILSNEKLTKRLEDVYNEKFNGYVSPDYKKASYLIKDTLDEVASGGIKLRDNQIEWITRAVYEGKGINAHDVGGGKTFSGIVLARALKNKGAVNKPLFVVPAKVIKNWEEEIKRAFPEAKIVNLFNLEKSTRAKKLFELGNNEADYILISHEGFKELKLPGDVERRYSDELLSENLKTEDLKGRALALQEEKIKKYQEVLRRENMDKRITIDKLGIDAIFADEARAFKNVGVHSKLVNFKLGKPFALSVNEKTGVVGLDSALAYDFRSKTRYISEKNNGRNVYMLDATPTPNKPMEIYTMLKHLDSKIFDEYGIYSDRDFANRYFEFGAKMNKKGDVENGLVYIKNAYELRSIMDRYVERISMQDFKDKGIITLPDEKVNTHYLDSSDESELVFSDVKSRLLAAKSDRTQRNKVMGIFSEGVSASTDPRSYQRAGVRDFIDPTPENNKLESVVTKVIARRKEDAKAGQIIFLDNAGHEQQLARDLDKDGGVYEATLDKNLHQEIKKKLIDSGRYKAEEIAIISGKEITDPKTGAEVRGASGQRGAEMKQAIVNAYDNGSVKVIIGTTKGAGEGMNIQRFTSDIYHMDIPWTPAEIIQRNGRGVRFGNENDLVNTHYFFQSGTFDELMYRTITNKRGWNEALWDAKVKDKIEIVDEGSAMPKEEEFMLQMEKDPLKRRALELQIEYGKLEDEFQAVNEEGYFLKGRRDSIRRGIEFSKEEIIALRERLSSDRPNKYLGELQDKIAKSKDAAQKAEWQADYDYKLKNSKANIEKMIEAKQKRIVEQELQLDKTHKAIENNKADTVDAGSKLSSFEERHIGSDGKIKAEIAEELC